MELEARAWLDLAWLGIVNLIESSVAAQQSNNRSANDEKVAFVFLFLCGCVAVWPSKLAQDEGF